MSRWSVAVIVFCSACQSKPTQNAQSKMTAEAVSQLIEIEAVVAYAPRRAQEMENTILLNAKVQDCLRSAPEIRDLQFNVGLEGYLNYKGVVEQVEVVHTSTALKECLAREIRALAFGRGRMGPFKLQVARPQATGTKAKPLLLDLSTVKKWE